MNKRILTGMLAAAAMLLPASPAYAGEPDAVSAYEAYRDSVMREYNGFRELVLSQYSDFMRGVWHDYEPLKPTVRDTQPKPREVPAVNPVKDKKPEQKPVLPRPEPEPVPQVKPQEQPGKVRPFYFHSLRVDVPQVTIPLSGRYDNTEDLAAQWDLLEDASVADKVLPALMAASEMAGLNDYLNYRLVSGYVDHAAPGAPLMGKMAVTQNLLAHWGYDVRIGYADNGAPLLFLPVKQHIYGKASMPLDGKDFYLFLPDGIDETALDGQIVHTYEVPPEVKRQKSFDMTLGELRFPEKPHPFELNYGKIHLKGEVNANLMPVLYHYPQLDIECYARSEIQPKLRESLVGQLRDQLAGMEEGTDVEELLSFMQHAFKYATDEDYHGFEKPYFMEENLYYDYNDCEDRALFYAYMLWHALGRENQIVFFPGHEATTVRLGKDIDGTSYERDGAVWYISDPTYVGAVTGQAMPACQGKTPKVEYTYRR